MRSMYHIYREGSKGLEVKLFNWDLARCDVTITLFELEQWRNQGKVVDLLKQLLKSARQ